MSQKTMGDPRARTAQLARDLGAVYAGELVSVVLYGSAARGEYRPGSDVNVLVLVRELTPAGLRKASAVARDWVAEGNPPPLVMSVDEWRRSADVFPIEVADMRDAHVVVAGEDPFQGLEVSPADLRLQCEKELKGKQIQLRERYLLFAGQPEELGELLVRSFSTFLVLFRTVLRLNGQPVARDAESVVRQLAERVGLDPAPLLEIHHARTAAQKPRPEADSPLATGYLDAVARVVEYVDRLVHGA